MHAQQADRVVLDSTPLVGPDAEYCRKIGFTDGRSFCPVRPEGDPERQACEAARVGRAADTGRYGPTWSANGKPLRRAATAGPRASTTPTTSTWRSPTAPATFRACAASGVCGEIALP